MQDRVVEPPIVRCPGCDQPMEAKERTSLKERLVDIRYVCAGCGMETKRTIADEARLKLQVANANWPEQVVHVSCVAAFCTSKSNNNRRAFN
jgi:hypothetical protein